jgi:hypothetical protein
LDPYGNIHGYVNDSYNPENTYHNIGNFFIGTGPIILGSVVVYILARSLLDPDVFRSAFALSFNLDNFGSWASLGALIQHAWNSAWSVLAGLFYLSNLTSWKFYVFVYAVFSVGSAITLSRQDIEGSGDGFAYLTVALLFLNFATLWMGSLVSDLCLLLARFAWCFYAVMLFVIMMLAVAAVFFSMIPLIGLPAARVVQRLRG